MYESFYNLSAKPFRLNLDPHYFYQSETHKRALAYMRYGIEQEQGFIVITGDVGTGKTTLISYLLENSGTENIEIARLNNTQLEPEDLLRMISAEFGLTYKRMNKVTILKNLESYFRVCMEKGKRPLLIVDEIQNLPWQSLEELRMLSNFQWQGKPMLQSFLLGQKEFQNTLQSDNLEQLRQRVIANYNIRPLDINETRHYIEHRLGVVDWDNDPGIDDSVFDGIYNYTQGNPRRINLLFDRILLYGILEEVHHINDKTLEAVLQDVKNELWIQKEPVKQGWVKRLFNKQK